MSDVYNNPYDSAIELSPEELMKTIFSDLPKSPNSLCILPYSEEIENDVASFNFEILITIFMEAIMDIERLATMLATKQKIPISFDEKHIDVYKITADILEVPKQWFNSFGYSYIVTEEECKTKIIDYIDDYYCKIILRDNPHDTEYFNMKRIDKPYFFLLGSKYTKTNKLENIKAVFLKPKKPKDINSKEMLYTIYFFPLNN